METDRPKSFLKGLAKRRLLPFMPTPAHKWLRGRKERSLANDHRDPVFLRVTNGLVFETCWKDVASGKGPGLIVWFDYRRILKFDCFGKGRGHYHVATRRPSPGFERIYLCEETIDAQIERVAFELRVNLRYYLAHSPYRGARAAVVPDADLLTAVSEARRLMHEKMVTAFAEH